MALSRRSTLVNAIACAALIATPLSLAARVSAAELPPVNVQQTVQGLNATIGPEQLYVVVCSDSIVHVVTRPRPGVGTHPQPWLLPDSQSCPGAPFTFAQDAKLATLTTAKIKLTLSLTRGNLQFLSLDGHQLLRESNNVPRTYEPVTLNNDATFHVTDRFSPADTEAFYGLGQHQSGLFNYRGSVVKLAQDNTDVAIPLLVSSNGYGLLWNSAALSYFDNRFPRESAFDSEAGDGVDYFFLYGPEMDDILHHYRSLTGHAPMIPRWSLGFIQSKDRYTSLDEINSIATRYRTDKIPIDVIVQDWFWWKHEGDPIFNDNYHDVPAGLAKLHAANIHTMISTWARLTPSSDSYKLMDAQHLMIGKTEAYDATSPVARKLYWDLLPGKLFAQGWDSFWLDSAEPEEAFPHQGDAVLRTQHLAIGNGALYTNIFPFVHNLGVQKHWRDASSDKRVFLLTRSAFIGQQRVGSTVWSGDIYSSFWALKRQVPAGLNFALSGMPYWTTDIGGYIPADEHQYQTPAYQELYLRWFEYGIFCPIFRTHGHRTQNELWAYPQIEPALIQYDKLRYRLMPYIYSLSAAVTQSDSTIQRPLVMDFRSDPATWNIADQFMFGPSIMVAPVTDEHATHRSVYLPAGRTWYDYWTGARYTGGQTIEAAAPLNRIPLYVPSGSLLILGPDEQYAAEKPNGPIELRVYPGADARFNLYLDEGDNYNYEHGQFATIPLVYSESAHTITLGPIQGSYPGMPQGVTFHVEFGPAPHTTARPTVAHTSHTLTLTTSGAPQTLTLK